MKSPQQQIFDAVFAVAVKLGYRTFDHLPATTVEYPFVFVGEQFAQDRQTKTSVYGTVQQTMHIYHMHRKRRELTDMMHALQAELRRIKHTETFYVSCKGIKLQAMLDSSTPETLLHGVLEIEFTFN
ncbi:hypothetical protein NSQ26_06040 [Bacillus sp. FSL W7-1360]